MEQNFKWNSGKEQPDRTEALIHKAYQRTRKKRIVLHPEYLDVFMRVLGNIPIGSVIELDSGETVIVVEPGGSDGDLPRVRVLKDAYGREVDEEIILDLNEVDSNTGRHKRHILDVSEAAVRDIHVGRYLMERD